VLTGGLACLQGAGTPRAVRPVIPTDFVRIKSSPAVQERQRGTGIEGKRVAIHRLSGRMAPHVAVGRRRDRPDTPPCIVMQRECMRWGVMRRGCMSMHTAWNDSANAAVQGHLRTHLTRSCRICAVPHEVQSATVPVITSKVADTMRVHHGPVRCGPTNCGTATRSSRTGSRPSASQLPAVPKQLSAPAPGSYVRWIGG